MIEPFRLSFVVACPAEHAFATWTAKTSAWWPSDHTVTCEADLDVIFEPRLGGRIYERTGDGREHDWGQITTWDPPRRLGYLWHLRAGREDATDVEIVFAEMTESSTRIEIEHRGWERLGSAGAARRQANQQGWQGLITPYAAECARW